MFVADKNIGIFSVEGGQYICFEWWLAAPVSGSSSGDVALSLIDWATVKFMLRGQRTVQNAVHVFTLEWLRYNKIKL